MLLSIRWIKIFKITGAGGIWFFYCARTSLILPYDKCCGVVSADGVTFEFGNSVRGLGQNRRLAGILTYTVDEVERVDSRHDQLAFGMKTRQTADATLVHIASDNSNDYVRLEMVSPLHCLRTYKLNYACRVAPKNPGTLCFVRLNFVKYWPIFKLSLFHCRNQRHTWGVVGSSLVTLLLRMLSWFRQ